MTALLPASIGVSEDERGGDGDGDGADTDMQPLIRYPHARAADSMQPQRTSDMRAEGLHAQADGSHQTQLYRQKRRQHQQQLQLQQQQQQQQRQQQSSGTPALSALSSLSLSSSSPGVSALDRVDSSSSSMDATPSERHSEGAGVYGSRVFGFDAPATEVPQGIGITTMYRSSSALHPGSKDTSAQTVIAAPSSISIRANGPSPLLPPSDLSASSIPAPSGLHHSYSVPVLSSFPHSLSPGSSSRLLSPSPLGAPDTPPSRDRLHPRRSILPLWLQLASTSANTVRQSHSLLQRCSLVSGRVSSILRVCGSYRWPLIRLLLLGLLLSSLLCVYLSATWEHWWFTQHPVRPLVLDQRADPHTGDVAVVRANTERAHALALPREVESFSPCRDVAWWDGFDPNVPPEERAARRAEWQSFVSALEPWPGSRYFREGSRGIVTSARSGSNSLGRLLTNLRMLRYEFGCVLGVEVFHFPGELSDDEKAQLRALDAVAVDITQMTLFAPINVTGGTASHNRKYYIKPAAILSSSFEQLLWLDTDNIPAADPAYLFDLPHFAEPNTALFWPDFWHSSARSPAFDILGVPCRGEDYEQESGQLVVDKRRAWHAVNLAYFLNRHHDFYYRFLLGDKDTFRLSWRALHTPFYFIRKYIAIAGFRYTDAGRTRVCGHSMVQHDPYGRPLFVHANQLKYHWNARFGPGTPLSLGQPNAWTVLQRYANSHSYLAPLCHTVDFLCCELPTDTPNAVLQFDFERQLPGFVTAYYAHGGPGATMDPD